MDSTKSDSLLKMLKKNKHAAMEMSVGTIVTIVLLVTVLVLGLVMVRSIFSSGTNAIGQIDQQIQAQINQLFTEGEGSSKVIIYPVNRELIMKKGVTDKGFGLSIQNTDPDPGKFSYEVKAEQVEKDCMTLQEADKLLGLGAKATDIPLNSREIVDPYRIVRFTLPDTAPVCKIRYNVEVQKNGKHYTSTTVDLIIK